MSVGIYSLKFGDLVYVGKSNNLERRRIDHLNNFSKGLFYSPKLKKAYEAHGNPEFNVLEHCSIASLSDREIFWISKLNSYVCGLNSTNGGDGGGSGVQHNRAKYTEAALLEVLDMLGSTTIYSYNEISLATGVPASTICNIVGERCHSWMKEEYPAKFQIIQNNRALRAQITNKGKKPNTSKYTNLSITALVSPDGIVYPIPPVAKHFATEHNMCSAGLSRLLSGKIKKHRGWVTLPTI